MSLLSRVIGFVAGEAICGSGSGSGSGSDDASFTGITGGRAKATSETGIQVGVSTSKAERQEQRRNQRLTSGIQRLRATVAAQAKASSTTSRLTSEAEDYHIGKTISKLLKPEKKTGDLTEEHTCCVCLDSIYVGNTNITRTSCGHVFHLSCLLKSLKVKNTCPMCRWELEDKRPNHQAPNVLTPVSAEQIISEEISYFPNAAHAQSIMLSRHPKRRMKELLRVFGFTLLRTVAEYIHEDNMPVGWYDDSETTDESDEDSEGEASGDDNDEASGSEASEDNDEASDNDNEASDNESQQAEANQEQDQDQEPVSRRVVLYSDSFPEPYSVIEDQMRDIRGSPGNIRVFNYWRQPGQSHLPLPPPPQNEDLRESLNRV